MIRVALPLLALATLALTACDNTAALEVTPVLQEETSFESGLDGWVVDKTVTSMGTAALATGDASAGTSYVAVSLTQGTDFVWLERMFTLEPSTDYNVTLSGDLRSFTGTADVRVVARATDPDGSGFSAEGHVPDSWTRVLAPKPVRSDAQGRVWVALGFQATGAASELGIDLLGAVFLLAGTQ